MSEWRPIETAPIGGGFLVSIVGMRDIAWPAYRNEDGRVWSRAHGLLNELGPGDRRITHATHWMPMPKPPTTSGVEK